MKKEKTSVNLVRRSSNGVNGFTLLELLLSMALLSIILAALYSTFFLSHRAIDGTDESLLKLRECRAIIDTISREVESVLYSQTNKKCVFAIQDRDIYGKQASQFAFTSFSPLRPGLSLISYFVEEKDGTMTLYKKVNDPYKPADENNGAELIENIEAFSVEAKDNKGEWVKTWDASNTGKVPEELRVTVTVKIKDKPVTLYETVQPKIGTTL
jgi:prepilin-type N-terminal cleavage/methylation domain-containing protein